MKDRVSRGSSDLQDRFYRNYKVFLESELEKLEQAQRGSRVPVEDELESP